MDPDPDPVAEAPEVAAPEAPEAPDERATAAEVAAKEDAAAEAVLPLAASTQ